MSPTADERLLVEAAQRDPGRFLDLYEHNFDRVYAYVASRVACRADAEDLTAEVFHQALANLPRFEWRGAPFATWLYRIAANALADHAKRAAREPAAPDPPDLDDPAAAGPDLAEVEERARLYRMVRRLPPDQRRVIDMRFAEEKSVREIARELGRTEGAVKQLQYRAIERLRARMGVSDGRS